MAASAGEMPATHLIRHQICVCGHSAAAHARGSSHCAFCSCSRFQLDHVETETQPVVAHQRGLGPAERNIPLAEIASHTDLSPHALVRAAKQAGITLLDTDDGRLINARDVPALERHLRSREPRHLAETVNAGDFHARLGGRGRTVTEPLLNRAVLRDPAREAEVEAVQLMLDPLANAHRRNPPRLPRGRRAAARRAEQRALDAILEPALASPPERSI